LGTKADRLPRATELRPDVTNQDIRTAFSAAQASRDTSADPTPPVTAAAAASASSREMEAALSVVAAPARSPGQPALKLRDEEIAALFARGRALIAAGNIRTGRLALEQAAEAGHAAAAFELGATYDPAILQRPSAPTATTVVRGTPNIPVPVADVAMARTWYEKARDLGSSEAAERLKALTSGSGARR
jgi:TPR repeat protein